MIFALVHGGLALLAVGSARHGPAALGRRLSPRSILMWRLGGWLMLGLSIAAVLGGTRWRIGLVHWFGSLGAAALLVTATLTIRPRWLPRSTPLLIVLAALSQLAGGMTGSC